MRQPSFAHLTGYDMWRRCDHHATRISESPARILLGPNSKPQGEGADPAPWSLVRGAAIRIDCPPDLCADGTVMLVDPSGRLFTLASTGWVSLPTLARMPAPLSEGPFDFAAPITDSSPLAIRDLARDPVGRIWLLDRTGRLLILSPGLQLLDNFLPAGNVQGSSIVACSWGVAVADGRRLLVQPFGGLWQQIALPGDVQALAADPETDLIIALLPGARLAILRRDTLVVLAIPELLRPAFLLVTGDGHVLIGEPRGVPGSPVETRFILCRIDPADGLVEEGALAVRGFDGRALWRDGHALYASTATGARRLYPDQAPGATEGMVETFALDSNIFACAWHRVFLDVCLPAATRIEVEARTSDDLPPRILWRAPHPPADIAGSIAVPIPSDDPWPPLGSTDNDPGIWHPIGTLDLRSAMADIPDPPAHIVRPSGDELAAARSPAAAPWPQATLEGLIKAPPGRYLWLRLRLFGTERRSPAIFAVRATHQRPSLLDLLPAYWRADPLAADATDRALALFEGNYTELDARITALRHCADPRLVPPEALDWLASHVALAFDQRIDEAVRRQLLAETTWLYRRRGTMPGLTRLLEILTGGPVQIIEGFRLRRRSLPFIGADGNAIGAAFQIGDEDGAMATPDDAADQALLASHLALQLRRTAAGNAACPAGDIPFPIESDPLARFVRRFAHRFTVILSRHRNDVLAAVIEDAIAASKPAHTIHRLCWIDAGYRLDRASMVGLTRLGAVSCFEPGVLGTAVLGRTETLGRHQTEFGIRPGTRIGQAQRETIGDLA